MHAVVYTVVYSDPVVVPEVLSVREFRAGLAAALASVRSEGLEPTLDGLEVLEGIASGRVEDDEGIAALRARHHQ